MDILGRFSKTVGSGFKSLCPCQNRKFVVKSYEFPIFVCLKVRNFHFQKIGDIRWAYGLIKK